MADPRLGWPSPQGALKPPARPWRCRQGHRGPEQGSDLLKVPQGGRDRRAESAEGLRRSDAGKARSRANTRGISGGQCGAVTAGEEGVFFFFPPFYSAKSLASSSAACLGYLWASVSPTSRPAALCGVACGFRPLCRGLEASCTATSPCVKQGRATRSWETALCPLVPPASPPSMDGPPGVSHRPPPRKAQLEVFGRGVGSRPANAPGEPDTDMLP